MPIADVEFVDARSAPRGTPNVEETATDELDTDLVLKPDGLGGVTWGAGGSGDVDPLAVTSIALGATPSTAGTVRLPLNGTITSRNAANAANIEHFKAATFVNDLDTYDNLLIGSQLLWDPDYGATLFGFSNTSIILANQARASYDGDSWTSVQSLLLGSGAIAMSNADDSSQFRSYFSGAELIVILKGLPTVDPAAAGYLWNNLGVLTISAG